jgi:hypothetical protein
MKNLFRSFCLLTIFISGSMVAVAQQPTAPAQLKTLGTRSWIRLTWQDNATNETGYKIYWSTGTTKPAAPGATIAANSNRYYVNGLTATTSYNIWIEAYNASGSSTALQTSVVTTRQWVLDTAEVNQLSIASSAAVPAGMQIFWQDEFNDLLLNRNKWSTNYYSTLDFKSGTNLSAMLNDTLPQPGIIMTGNAIQLIVNDTMPAKAYWPTRKLSSIQTYDWRSNEKYLDNRRGGYYEIRVRRSNTAGATTGLNAAYWMDAPGPDLKYYMETGNTYNGVTGIRPRGQVFEIDIFEQSGNASSTTTTPFTLHGNVAADGTFQGNLTTYNASSSTQNNWTTHGLLWTAAGIKYYIDGVLKKEWNDPLHNMAPNHFMNILLGNYYGWTAGMTSTATMEVDYIRGYQWPVVLGNELPTAGFVYGTLLPWSGNGTLSATSKRTGNGGLVLAAGQSETQYVYLDHSNNYQLNYWLQGSGNLQVKVENLAQVTAVVQSTYQATTTANATFGKDSLMFVTGSEYADHMKTIKLTLTNTGTGSITIDDLTLTKGGSGGQAVICTATGGANAQDRYITGLSSTNGTHNISYTNAAYPANGYGFYTADSIVVKKDTTFTLNITNSPNTNWAWVIVYADWNGNGSFTDSGELLFTAGNAKQDNSSTVLNISRVISVPAAAVTGKVRLRVRFYDAWNTDPGPCGQADYTTTHDFSIRVNAVSGLMSMAQQKEVAVASVDAHTFSAAAISVYPNPLAGNTFLLTVQVPKTEQAVISIYNLAGKRLYNMPQQLRKGNNKVSLTTGDWPGGIYVIHVQYPGQLLQCKLVKQ